MQFVRGRLFTLAEDALGHHVVRKASCLRLNADELHAAVFSLMGRTMTRGRNPASATGFKLPNLLVDPKPAAASQHAAKLLAFLAEGHKQHHGACSRTSHFCARVFAPSTRRYRRYKHRRPDACRLGPLAAALQGGRLGPRHRKAERNQRKFAHFRRPLRRC